MYPRQVKKKVDRIMRSNLYSPRCRLVAAELKRARESRGWTQAQAAKVAGKSRTWIGKIERCELRLDVIQLMHLCHHYGIGLQRLIRRLEEEPPDEDGSFYLSGWLLDSTCETVPTLTWIMPT